MKEKAGVWKKAKASAQRWRRRRGGGAGRCGVCTWAPISSPHLPYQAPCAQGRVEFGDVVRVSEGQGQQEQVRQMQQAEAELLGQQVASFYSQLVETQASDHWVDESATVQAQDQRPLPLSAPDAQYAAATAAQQPHAGVHVLLPRGGAAGSSSGGGGGASSTGGFVSEQHSYGQPAGPSGRPPDGGAGEAAALVRLGIERSNIGFRLLQRAGWREGAGLGREEQGVREPIQPQAQQGQQGLGFAPRPRPTAQRREGEAGAAGAGDGQQQQALQQRKLERPLPEDPLDKETTEQKVKRVKQVRACGSAQQHWPAPPLPAQTCHATLTACLHWLASPPQVMQADADDRAGKAISRYIYSAFRDQTGEPTADSNPLLRPGRSKLNATNPLL